MTHTPTKKNSPWMLIILSLGFIMAVLDTTGVVLAVPSIEKALNISFNNSIWILNSYILALSSLLLLSGNLVRKYGATRLFITGMGLFIIASIGSGCSINVWTIVIFRLIQGAGAALFMPSSMTLLFISYPDPTERAKVLGIWTTIISVATGTGSLIGGTLITTFGWRSIFFINVPLGLIAILYIYSQKIEVPYNLNLKISIVDNIVLFFALTSLVIFLVNGKQIGYLSSKNSIFGITFVVTLTTLIFLEKKSTNPIIPFDLLKRKNFLTANLFGLVINISLYGLTLVLGLYFQTQLKYSAMLAGLLILPGMCVLILGNLFYTKMIQKIKTNTLVSLATTITIISSLILLIFATKLNPLPAGVIIIFFATMCFGLGILTPVTTTILMDSAGKKYSSIAGAALNTNKQIGGLFGTTILGIIIATNQSNWQTILILTFSLQVILYGVTVLIDKLSEHSHH
ncbi:MFS transporter [Weissella minor]|nr:MFS transporter [Weissella minor]